MVYKRVCRNCSISSCGAKYLVKLANRLADVHQLDHIQRRQWIIPEKITQLVLAIQYRYKKRCTNCQGHEEMKPLLKQKLKEQLQKTRQTQRNKESRTLGLEANQLQKYLRHCTVFWLFWPVHDLVLVTPLHPFSKLLAIQDHAQNLEEQL